MKTKKERSRKVKGKACKAGNKEKKLDREYDDGFNTIKDTVFSSETHVSEQGLGGSGVGQSSPGNSEKDYRIRFKIGDSDGVPNPLLIQKVEEKKIFITPNKKKSPRKGKRRTTIGEESKFNGYQDRLENFTNEDSGLHIEIPVSSTPIIDGSCRSKSKNITESSEISPKNRKNMPGKYLSGGNFDATSDLSEETHPVKLAGDRAGRGNLSVLMNLARMESSSRNDTP